MAIVNYDSNKQEDDNTTNVLGPSASGTPASTTQSQVQSSTAEPLATTSSSTYVSNGNPYGSYGSPQSQQPSASAGTQSTRKSNTGASSGQFTNVQSYVDKNKQSSQALGNTVSGKLQNTSDIAKQNLQSVENKFGQGVNAGSLENYQGAVGEVKTAANEAANQTAANKTWNANQASMYTPTKNADGTYSAADQALVDKNLARVLYGDGSTKDFATQAEATSDLNSYNKANPGYFTYGNEKDLSVSDDRLKDILNAKYQGPNELSEIAGYGSAYNKFQDASALQNQTLKGGSNNELLNRTFATPQSEYSYGSKLLDNLLLGQGEANQKLRSTAEGLGTTATGKLSDEFTSRTKDARGQAATRTGEINQVKESARAALNDTSLSRNKEVNDRIGNVIKDWDKYPQYFRDRFQGALDKQSQANQKSQQYKALAPQMEAYNIAKNVVNSSSDTMKYYNSINPETYVNDYYNGKYNLGIDTQLQNYLGSRTVDATPQAIKDGVDYLKYQAQQKIQQSQQQLNTLEPLKKQYDELAQYANIDPNALNLELSQLESEALGIQGGEGLYNVLKNQGVEGLLKTAAYDKNKLVSEDEQSQLARLQSIAQLANDYGVKGSGANFQNKFTERDLAGQQNATSALDTDNFKNLLQGAERTFRTDAAGSNIAGSGYGTGSSSGLFGKKKAQAWQTYNQNFGDLIQGAGGYRNIYSDEGVNTDLLKKAAQASQGKQSFNVGDVDPGAVGGTIDAIGAPIDKLQGLLGSSTAGKAATNYALFSNPLTAPMALANILGSTLGGSKAAAQGEADRAASANAIANLQSNILNKINTSGLKNQFSVGQNTAQDMKLYKLLGLLDTTNL